MVVEMKKKRMIGADLTLIFQRMMLDVFLIIVYITRPKVTIVE